jgi:hypothetical protein
MMRHYLHLLLVGAVLLGVAACAAPRAAEPATFVYKPLKGDPRITFHASDDMLLLDIASFTGIGAAEVEKTSGQWPPKVVMRFRLKGLEESRFTYGQHTVEVHVASTAEHAVREFLVNQGQVATLSPGSPYWMNVTSATGHFDVEAPPDFLKSAETKFKIEWIDFYR